MNDLMTVEQIKEFPMTAKAHIEGLRKQLKLCQRDYEVMYKLQQASENEQD